MSKRFRFIPVFLLVAILGSIAWWTSRQPQEPVYQGKPLSDWLRPYEAGGILQDPVNIEIWRKADEAVHAIGTNAIPFLLQRIQTTDFSLPRRLVRLAAKQRLVNIQYIPATYLGCEAVVAFGRLGAVASNAVPDLIAIGYQNISAESECDSIESLGKIGPAASNAVPLLLKCLSETNDSVRGAATMALGQIHGEPKSVVPALIKMLRDGDPGVRVCAACALGEFGIEVRPAIPLLIEYFNSEPANSWSARKPAIGEAIKKIDAEAAANAGVP